MNKLKVVSLFSGIGAIEKSLKNIGVDFELVRFSEIDEFAIKSYCAIHNVPSELNLGDITKADIYSVPDFDMMTYGFPCTDISTAGAQEGFEEGSNTRSSTLWDAMRLAKHKNPKYMLAENVDNLLSKKFDKDFKKWLSMLDGMGYNTYYTLLNSLDFGIPQNRERVFVLSIRKDVDDGTFQFPTSKPLMWTVKSFLQNEDEVAKNFYSSEEHTKRFFDSMKTDKYPMGKVYKVIGSTVGEGKGTNSRQWVYSINSNIGTLAATDYKQPKQIFVNNKVRKTTPLEYWRLMGFTDEDFLKAQGAGVSNTQLYRQAGNSIVTTVTDAILRNLFKK